MSTAPLHRSVSAFVAVSSLLFTQACFAYQRPPAGKGISPHSRVRVQSVEPFVVVAAGAEDPTEARPACRATIVEGFVSSASSDAVTFQGLRRLVPANGDAVSCRWAKTSVVIVPIKARNLPALTACGVRAAECGSAKPAASRSRTSTPNRSAAGEAVLPHDAARTPLPAR
jgi:hypothetical protein